MLSFVLSRLISAAIVVAGVVTIVFALIHLTPGDPVEVMLGESASTADRQALRRQLGLDRPLAEQLGHYYLRLARGDLGTSLHSGRDIQAILAERVPYTAALAGASLALAIFMALPLGALAATNRGRVWDGAAMTFAVLGLSLPNIWLGPMLILVFSFQLGWFPVSGTGGALAIVLPALTLGTALAAILARMVRATLLETLGAAYVTTARAKGLSRLAVVSRHAGRNAALPVLTVIGLQLGALLGGAVVTEIVFAWPGLGQLLVESIQRRDYPVVQAVVLLVSVVYVAVNTAVDLMYAWLDPRIRLT